MAKQNNKQARTTVDEVNETLTSWEQKLENNRKLIYGICSCCNLYHGSQQWYARRSKYGQQGRYGICD